MTTTPELPELPPFDYYVTLANGDDYGCWTSSTMRAYALAALAVTKQEPVLHQYRMRPTWGETPRAWLEWTDCSAEAYADYVKTPILHNWEYEVRKLYTAPQPAQPAPEQTISLAAYDRLQALCDSQAARIIELEAAQPSPEQQGYVPLSEDGKYVFIEGFGEVALDYKAGRTAQPAPVPAEQAQPIMFGDPTENRPIETMDISLLCRIIKDTTVFDADAIEKAWKELVRFYVAHRAAQPSQQPTPDPDCPLCGGEGTAPVWLKRRDAIGEMREGGVVWFGPNPHAHPVGTQFFAAPPSPSPDKYDISNAKTAYWAYRCPDCAKPTNEGHIHTCSPQVAKDEHCAAERLAQLEQWVDAVGAIPKHSSWYGELQAIVAGRGEPVTDYAALEREHLGDPDKKTGVYADGGKRD
jgi:hypothetical protein